MSESLRAVALYRASTKQQTSKDNNDIPTQKQIVRDFIFKNEWTLIRELTEGEVSGFSQSEKKRDALQTIKQMAVKKEFDALVVYMSDRIGRIADETPLVISFLNKHGVKVISTTEGEIKTGTHSDKLMTYLRYWQNEGESIKTRQRVTDYHIAAVENGRFRGGSYLPFGYKLIDNGNKNFKGRHILDFVIDTEQSEIVKLIYKLSLENNYGQSRIAKYLNENSYKAPKSVAWHSTTIQSILNNPIYKGQMKYNSKLYNKQVLSPIQDELIIIQELDWERNQKIMKSRMYKSNSIVQQDKRNRNTHGCLLFSGLIFCGYCGVSLTTMTSYSRWTTSDGTKKRTAYHKYRCGSFYKKGGIKCEGQTTYGVSKIEPILLKYIKQTIIEIQKEKIDRNYIDDINHQIVKCISRKKDIEKTIQNIFEEIKTLENEITKSLLGKSTFTPELLNKVLQEKNYEILQKEEILKNIEGEIENLKISKEQYIKFGFNLNNWITEFDNADFETKKAKIAEVIDKIVIKKNEHEITYKLTVEKYKENMGSKNPDVVRVPR